MWSKLWRTERGQIDWQTDGQTDKSKNWGTSKILSNDIFYFKTVIIGGPIYYNIITKIKAYMQNKQQFYLNNIKHALELELALLGKVYLHIVLKLCDCVIIYSVGRTKS